MNRRTELYLGMAGGILGIIASIWSAFYNAAWNLILYPYYIYSNHIALFIISIIGILGASLVRTHSRWAAACMLIAAILGFVLSSALYLIPAILLFVGGVMSLYRGYGHDVNWIHRHTK